MIQCKKTRKRILSSENTTQRSLLPEELEKVFLKALRRSEVSGVLGRSRVLRGADMSAVLVSQATMQRKNDDT